VRPQSLFPLSVSRYALVPFGGAEGSIDRDDFTSSHQSHILHHQLTEHAQTNHDYGITHLMFGFAHSILCRHGQEEPGGLLVGYFLGN